MSNSTAGLSKPVRIVIVGGGYVGMYTALGLQRKLSRGAADIVVIDPQSNMTYQPFLPEAAAGSVVAVVGPNADDPHAQLGDWAGASGQADWMPDGHPRETVETVLDGFRAVAPANWTVTHARGAEIGVLKPHPAGLLFPDGQPRFPVLEPASPDPLMIAEAVAAAQSADYVIAVVGDNVALTGEERPTATLELVGAQVALLDALATTGTPMIVVLVNSKPAVLPPSALNAAALIQAFNPGMRGGRAIAELILGQIEPTGRLPVSFARHVGQQPVYYNVLRGQRGLKHHFGVGKFLVGQQLCSRIVKVPRRDGRWEIRSGISDGMEAGRQDKQQ